MLRLDALSNRSFAATHERRRRNSAAYVHATECSRPRECFSSRMCRTTLSGTKLVKAEIAHLRRGRLYEPQSRIRDATYATSATGHDAHASADLSAFVQIAHELADTAAAVTTPYFRSKLSIDSKSDESPVTVADREAEAAMRNSLTNRLPDHDIFGEEEGMTAGSGGHGSSKWLWVLDPIDGTKSFVTGKPVYGTLIALLCDGIPVVGIIDQPITKERWVGVSGQQTQLNGSPVCCRRCPGGVSEAYMYATTPHMFEAEQVAAPWARIRDAVKQDLYGCDCYAYGLLATGCIDLVVEADMKPYDFLAMIPIVEGSGGRISNWQGEPIKWHRSPSGEYVLDALRGEVLAAGDPEVHQEALEILNFKQ